MSTATAAPPARRETPNPGVEAACELLATDWSPWQLALFGLTWADYDRLLAARAAAGRKRVRITYDRGAAYIVTPGGQPRETVAPGTTGATTMTAGNRHERWKKLVARLLEAAALGFRVSVVACGNLTLSRPDLDRGFEPDECYYVQNAARVGAIRELDFRTDPPPDLALEIEITRGLLDRLDLYAALGVPEIWRFDGEHLRFQARGVAGTYVEIPASLAFPAVTSAHLGAYLARAGTVDDTALCLELLDWARQAAPNA